MSRPLARLAAVCVLSLPASAQWVGGASYYLWTDDHVGIQTDDPQAPLHVVGDWTAYPAVLIENPTAGGIGLTAKTSEPEGRAINALSGNKNGSGTGVWGGSYAAKGTGVAGVAYGGSGSTGVYGYAGAQGYSGHFAGGRFYVQGTYAGVNRDSPVGTTDVFGVLANTNGWGGMFMGTHAGGLPYYGYAIDNASRAYHYYEPTSDQWRLYIGGDWLTVGGNGRVGIRTSSPSYDLHVNGTAGKPGGGSWATASDLRLKKDVRPLEGALERLLALHGVTFEYTDPEAIGELAGRRTGVIAQEVEDVFPDWVDEGPDGYKRVTFRGFEAIAVEAVRELDAKASALERENAELRASLARLEARLDALAASPSSF